MTTTEVFLLALALVGFTVAFASLGINIGKVLMLKERKMVLRCALFALDNIKNRIKEAENRSDVVELSREFYAVLSACVEGFKE